MFGHVLREWLLRALHGYRYLDGLNRNGQQGIGRLRQQEVNIFRHDDITDHQKLIPAPKLFQGLLE